MYAVNAHKDMSDDQAQDIIAFVQGGGGLVIAGQAWWWNSQNKESSYVAYPGNKWAAAHTAYAGKIITLPIRIYRVVPFIVNFFLKTL